MTQLARLTSAGDEHGVAPGLHVLLVALHRQSHSVFTGVELAMDLSTGPSQHFTGANSHTRGTVKSSIRL